MKVSWKILVLEAWIVTLVKVSWKMLVLEAWIVTFGESLVENTRFGSFGIVTFGESLVENTRFGSLDCHFW